MQYMRNRLQIIIAFTTIVGTTQQRKTTKMYIYEHLYSIIYQKPHQNRAIRLTAMMQQTDTHVDVKLITPLFLRRGLKRLIKKDVIQNTGSDLTF